MIFLLVARSERASLPLQTVFLPALIWRERQRSF